VIPVTRIEEAVYGALVSGPADMVFQRQHLPVCNGVV